MHRRLISASLLSLVVAFPGCGTSQMPSVPPPPPAGSVPPAPPVGELPPGASSKMKRANPATPNAL